MGLLSNRLNERMSNMKIEPVKNYKKPNYAMRLASIITAAGSLAGCSTSPQLDGDVTVADTEPATTATDVTFMGDVETTEETCVELDGDIAVIPEETTTTTPAVTTTDNARIAVPGMAPVAEETTPAATTKRRTQTYATATTTELEIDGMITTAEEKTTTATTTEVMTAGVAPIYTEETTTTEPELAGDVVIDGGIMPYME